MPVPKDVSTYHISRKTWDNNVNNKQHLVSNNSHDSASLEPHQLISATFLVSRCGHSRFDLLDSLKQIICIRQQSSHQGSATMKFSQVLPSQPLTRLYHVSRRWIHVVIITCVAMTSLRPPTSHGYITRIEQCEPIEIPRCRAMPYNLTRMPNLVHHSNQVNARLVFEKYEVLIGKCDPPTHRPTDTDQRTD